MAVQPANKKIAGAVCPAVLYRLKVSKFLTVAPGGTHKNSVYDKGEKIAKAVHKTHRSVKQQKNIIGLLT